MNVKRVAELPELMVVDPQVHRDRRGSLLEAYRRERYRSHGIGDEFVQTNEIVSRSGVLRGLHFQHPDPQARLVRVVRGGVFEVAVDIRRHSPTFGRWHALELSSENHLQLYVPPGFAHGFLATEEEAVVVLGCSAYHVPEHQRTIAWNDPALDIPWPHDDPLVSRRDASAATLEAARREGFLPTISD